MRRHATLYDGPRYPKIYPSQVVVRRRKALYDRGFIELCCRVWVGQPFRMV